MINNNLKYCREELEMTQKELGFIFGVSQYTISGWENAHDSIPLPKLVKFCNTYNYSIDFVTGLSKKKSVLNNKIDLDKDTIGINLKNFRKSLNLTQTEIANECSISQTTYSNYERGCNLITTMTLYTICKKYNLSMEGMLSLCESIWNS